MPAGIWPRVLDACPLPCLLLDEDRTVKRLNQAFATWLHLDARGVLGQRLDNMMILRGQGMPALWERIFGEAGGRGCFNATYVSGKVRTAQALAISLVADIGAAAGPSLPDHVRDPGRPHLNGAALTRGARLLRIRCSVRRCMLRRRAVSETLRLHCSNTRWMCSQRT